MLLADGSFYADANKPGFVFVFARNAQMNVCAWMRRRLRRRSRLGRFVGATREAAKFSGGLKYDGHRLGSQPVRMRWRGYRPFVDSDGDNDDSVWMRRTRSRVISIYALCWNFALTSTGWAKHETQHQSCMARRCAQTFHTHTPTDKIPRHT